MQDKNEQLAPWRVLVLYKSARCARRDKHTPATQLDRRNSENQAHDGCEVAAEPLGDPSHFPVGAKFDL